MPPTRYRGQLPLHDLILMKRCALVIALCLLGTMRLMAQGSDSIVREIFRQKGFPFYEDNEVKLLPTGREKYDDLFGCVQSARRFIHMDYFKFQQDSICRALFDILAHKAGQGVEVRVVYDSFGNRYSDLPLTDSYLDSLRTAGIQIEEFDRVRFPWINHLRHRNHHKIAIIDGEAAYTGGMNVADYYLHGKPSVGEWRDMHMKVRGSMVNGYERVFEDMWWRATKERLDSTRYLTQPFPAGHTSMAMVERIPKKSGKVIRKTYCIAIDHADNIIQIVNPYPTLVKSIRKSLEHALARGVRVQIMASTKSDGPVTPDVVGQEMHKLMKKGAEVFYYDGGFHHSKVMMVDGLFCTVGTANLDARSLRFDYEVNAFIFDRQVTSQLQDIFYRDVHAHCTLLTPENWKYRFPLKRRISGRVFSSIKGFL